MKQKKQSAAQVRAGKAFAAAGRSAQASSRKAAIQKTGKPPPRSKKQQAATQKFLAAGKAALARKRAGLKPLPKAQPALAPPGVNDRPVCAAVAVAEHLYAATGIIASDGDILALAAGCTGGSLGDVIEAAATGFAGIRLAGFWPCDEELALPGLIYGVRMPGGYHAVLAHPGGVISWGILMPRLGVPAEAWHLEWDTH